ncbi:hypothetical protein DCD76_19160, partial [Acinetobacter baumannii]|uniref:hypothetical protein n=1 Tax=Acinetobacter baumannii TaxID=470 RepID=UPI000DE765D3
DLPYPNHEPSAKNNNNNPNKDVQLLMGLYKKVSDALIERYEKDGTLDIMADGKDGLNLKFKNGEPYIGHIY